MKVHLLLLLLLLPTPSSARCDKIQWVANDNPTYTFKVSVRATPESPATLETPATLEAPTTLETPATLEPIAATAYPIPNSLAVVYEARLPKGLEWRRGNSYVVQVYAVAPDGTMSPPSNSITRSWAECFDTNQDNSVTIKDFGTFRSWFGASWEG